MASWHGNSGCSRKCQQQRCRRRPVTPGQSMSSAVNVSGKSRNRLESVSKSSNTFRWPLEATPLRVTTYVSSDLCVPRVRTNSCSASSAFVSSVRSSRASLLERSYDRSPTSSVTCSGPLFRTDGLLLENFSIRSVLAPIHRSVRKRPTVKICLWNVYTQPTPELNL